MVIIQKGSFATVWDGECFRPREDLAPHEIPRYANIQAALEALNEADPEMPLDGVSGAEATDECCRSAKTSDLVEGPGGKLACPACGTVLAKFRQ